MRSVSRFAAAAASLLIAVAAIFFAGCEVSAYYDEDYLTAAVSESSAQAAEPKYDYTLMVYMCGSNLESIDGSATADIREIINGYKTSNVNIIIQTGGAENWKYKNIPNDKCCRYKVTSKGLMLLDDTVGNKSMGERTTLGNFIKYCRKNYAAKHYGLILWDHGGGSLYGFGADENFDNDELDLKEIRKALKSGGTTFDFIGFDACLMATLETALTVADYTPYLIAAEDTEPGIGWYYTEWIGRLCGNPSLNTLILGKNIADSTVNTVLRYDRSAVTNISVIDTKKAASLVLPRLDDFSSACISMLKNQRYYQIALARVDSELYSAGYDMADICRLCENLSLDSKSSTYLSPLKKAVKSAVVYNRNSTSGLDLCGMSIAFPFADITTLDFLNEVYDQTGYSTKYTEFLEYFANIMAGGQEYCDPGKDSKYVGCKWYDKSKFYSENAYSHYYLSERDLTLVTENGKPTLTFAANKNYFITDIRTEMWLFRKKNVSSTDSDAELVLYGIDNRCYSVRKSEDKVKVSLDYDRTWAAINGVIVPEFYDYSVFIGNKLFHFSYVPCLYNDVDAYLYIIRDNSKSRKGAVYAWAPLDDNGNPSRYYYTENGDVITPLFTYYDFSGKVHYNDYYSSQMLKVNNNINAGYENAMDLDGQVIVCLEFRDVFNNLYTSSYVSYNRGGYKIL